MNKILIVGRTGAGKDTVAKILEEKNLKILKSYATRPKRSEDENTHIFISPEEVNKYEADMIAYTKIGEYEYFSTRTQLQNSDIYIIDPKGITELLLNTDGIFDYTIVYVEAEKFKRISRSCNRETYTDGTAIFINRDKAEDEQFTNFEYKISCKDYYKLNDKEIPVIRIVNNFDNLNDLKQYVFNILNV